MEGLYSGENSSDSALEEEGNVHIDDKRDTLLRSEFDRALNSLKHGKAVGIDDIPAEILQSMGELGHWERLFQMTCRPKKYEAGDISFDYQKSIIYTMAETAQADKCKHCRTISIVSHATKILTRIIHGRIEKRIEEMSEDQFGFRKNKGTGTQEAILTLRLLIEGKLKKN